MNLSDQEVERAVDEIFRDMPRHVNVAAVQGLNAVVHYDLHGVGGGSRYLLIQNGEASVARASSSRPTVTLSLSGRDFLDLVTGRLHGGEAVRSGKLRVHGDATFISRLADLFGQPPASQPSPPSATGAPTSEQLREVGAHEAPTGSMDTAVEETDRSLKAAKIAVLAAIRGRDKQSTRHELRSVGLTEAEATGILNEMDRIKSAEVFMPTRVQLHDHVRAQTTEATTFFECPVSDGPYVCSDDSCPCSGTVSLVPGETGYVYIDEEVVRNRAGCLMWAAVEAEAQRRGEAFDRLIGRSTMRIYGQGIFVPIFMCHAGAEARRLDREVAAADAANWLKTGLLPLRATPPEASTPWSRFWSRPGRLIRRLAARGGRGDAEVRAAVEQRFVNEIASRFAEPAARIAATRTPPQDFQKPYECEGCTTVFSASELPDRNDWQSCELCGGNISTRPIVDCRSCRVALRISKGHEGAVTCPHCGDTFCLPSAT